MAWPNWGGLRAARHTYELVGHGENGEASRGAPATSAGRNHRLSSWLPSGTALVLIFVAFALGYIVGDVKPGPFVKVSHMAYPAATGNTSVLNLLRALPPLDLMEEYGLDESKFKTRYPRMGKKICIIQSDTRLWKPSVNSTGTTITDKDFHGWGTFNHYLYSLYHGYTFKRIRVPEQPGRHGTWVKVLEQYRMTMSGECSFVLLMDADTIWQDIRVPFEVLLGYWGVTKDDALIGAVDLGKDDTGDIRGNPYINTGFIITQKTEVLPKLMRDWANCPTGVRYPECVQWADVFFHEQSALSNHIRYDPEYRPYIRELPCDEIHWPGKYVKHYWGNTKDQMPYASKEAITQRFIPAIMQEMSRTWDTENYYHVESLKEYDFLMDPDYTG